MTISARTPTLAEVVNRAVQLALARVFKVRVGSIDSFDASTGLADVKPLQMEVQEQDGAEDVAYSVATVTNVPVMCLGGGNYADTFPVQKGDECILLCCDRSIDLWFENGGEQDPKFLHRHSLTDAIAIVGLRSKPNKLTEWPTDRREIGKQGGPRIALKDSEVHLGVDSGEDATDNVTLASLAKNELKALHDKLDTFISTFNTHTHTVSTAGPPLAHTGTAAPPISQGPVLSPVGDVKSTKVFCK